MGKVSKEDVELAMRRHELLWAMGVDPHTKTAMEIFSIPEEAVTLGHRDIAKQVNFARMYTPT